MPDDLRRIHIKTSQARPGGNIDTDAPGDRIFDPVMAPRSRRRRRSHMKHVPKGKIDRNKLPIDMP